MTDTTTPRYVGILHLGPSYSEPQMAADAYVWDTLDDVRASLNSAARGYGINASVAEWDDEDGPARRGTHDSSLTPCTDGVTVIVWRNLPGTLRAAETEGFYSADYAIDYGPRGGIRTHRNAFDAGMFTPRD